MSTVEIITTDAGPNDCLVYTTKVHIDTTRDKVYVPGANQLIPEIYDFLNARGCRSWSHQSNGTFEVRFVFYNMQEDDLVMFKLKFI
jgi:hypothetical protein